jgi:hypothetical protein
MEGDWFDVMRKRLIVGMTDATGHREGFTYEP